jgi:ABC-type glutathione transport system ATPase component
MAMRFAPRSTCAARSPTCAAGAGAGEAWPRGGFGVGDDTGEAPRPEVETVLAVRGISKGFPECRGARDIDWDVRAGEVHRTGGQNGAGKSTLIKILSGAHAPDSGTIEIDGRPVQFQPPIDAQAAGSSRSIRS